MSVEDSIRKKWLEAASRVSSHSASLLWSWSSTIYRSLSVTSITEMVSWLCVWGLTRIGLGGYMHRVDIRCPIRRTCPEVYKTHVPYVLPECPCRNGLFAEIQKPTFHYHRCSATKMLGPVPKLQHSSYTGEIENLSPSRTLPCVFNN